MAIAGDSSSAASAASSSSSSPTMSMSISMSHSNNSHSHEDGTTTSTTKQQVDDDHDHEHDMVMPGFRFHPTEEELVEFYLRRKVEGKRFNVELITFLDLYRYDPWELPALAAIGEKEWYFYVPRDRKYRNGDRPNRVTTSGYWKATGADRMIRTENFRSIGLKKTLVFYSGKAPKGIRTSWIMNEYRLPQHETERYHKVEISLCRVYKRAGVEDHPSLPRCLPTRPISSSSNSSSRSDHSNSKQKHINITNNTDHETIQYHSSASMGFMGHPSKPADKILSTSETDQEGISSSTAAAAAAAGGSSDHHHHHHHVISTALGLSKHNINIAAAANYRAAMPMGTTVLTTTTTTTMEDDEEGGLMMNHHHMNMMQQQQQQQLPKQANAAESSYFPSGHAAATAGGSSNSSTNNNNSNNNNLDDLNRLVSYQQQQQQQQYYTAIQSHPPNNHHHFSNLLMMQPTATATAMSLNSLMPITPTGGAATLSVDRLWDWNPIPPEANRPEYSNMSFK